MTTRKPRWPSIPGRPTNSDIEIREDPISTADYPMWRAIITIQGRCYYAIYAGDKPSVDKVKQDWAADLIYGIFGRNWKRL